MNQENNPKVVPEWKRAVGKRHEEFYTSKGFNRKDYAAYINEDYEKVRTYDRGISMPSPEYLAKVKDLFPDLNVGYILLGIVDSNTINPSIEPGVNEVRVSILNEVSAGSMTFNFSDDQVIGHIYTQNLKDKDLYALRVKGDSMAPEISAGDVVVIAPHRAFVNGQIYVVVAGDSEATLKRVYRKSGGYELVAENPDYRTTFVPDNQIIKLLRVLEARKNYESTTY